MSETQESSQAPRFHVVGQYVKDLSFENPNAPQSLISSEEKPRIDVNIDLAAQKLKDELFEVTLKITAKALLKDSALFVADVSYSGLFSLINIPEDRVEQILMVDCPFILFPYARRVISDVTRDGGFPPLLLEPIDFFNMYKKKKENTPQKMDA